jgi:UDP-N-acetylmuramate-alanine ligase
MNENICTLGICGAGMTALTIYRAQRGDGVNGWDDYANLLIQGLLISHGIIFMSEQILASNSDCVVQSSAVNEQRDSICQRATKNSKDLLEQEIACDRWVPREDFCFRCVCGDS